MHLNLNSVTCNFTTETQGNNYAIKKVFCQFPKYDFTVSTKSVKLSKGAEKNGMLFTRSEDNLYVKHKDIELKVRKLTEDSLSFSVSAFEKRFAGNDICEEKIPFTIKTDKFHLTLYFLIALSLLCFIIIPFIDDAAEATRVESFQKIRSPWFDKLAFFLRYLVTDEFFVFLGPTLTFTAPVDVGPAFLANSSLAEIFNGFLKWVYQKPRPFWVKKGVQNIGAIWEQDYSFPSSHATTSATFVALLMLKLDTGFFGIFLTIFSFLAGVSRVYLGVHPWSHVIIGWIFGVTQAFLFVKIDVIDWVTKLEENEQIALAIAFPFLVYSILFLLRKSFALPHREVLDKWSDTAVYNTKKEEKTSQTNFLQARRLDKYNFQIFGQSMGIIGMIFAIRFAKNGKLRLIEETRNLECLRALFGRAIIGIAGLLLLFVIIFVMAPKLKKTNYTFGTIIQSIFMGLSGFWAVFGCGFVAYYGFGLECSIHQCHNTKLNLNSPSLFSHKMLDFNQTQCSMVSVNPTVVKHPPQVQPKNVKELKQLILNAGKSGKIIRAGGSYHSYPIHLHTATYDTRVQHVSMRSFRHYEMREENGRKIVIAGAGICLGESMYNPGCTLENSLTYKLWQDGLGLPHLSGISLQTLSGFLSTDTQGGSVHYQLKQAVIGYRWINGLGQLREAWKNDTKTEEEFYSVGISMGLAGVFYEIILAPEPRYCVHVTTKALDDPFIKKSGKNAIEHALLDESQDYSRILMVGGMDQYHQWKSSAITTIANRMKIPFDKTHNCDGKEKNQELINFYPQPILSITMGAETIQQKFDICKKELNSDVCNAKLLKIAMDGATNRQERIQVERCLKALHTDMVDKKPKYNSDYKKINGPLPRILGSCWVDLLKTIDDDAYKGRYYLNLPFDNQAEIHSHEVILMSEIFFPLDTNNATEVVDALEDFYKIYKNQYSSLLVHWEIYSCPVSKFYLSPCYNTRAIRFSLFSALRNRPNDNEQKEVWETFWSHFYLRGFKFRFHWGKTTPAWLPNLSPKIMADAVASYPKLKEWREFILKEDPNHVFVSKYWERTGLLKI